MSGEKTEEPTPKKLRKAREEGNVAKSKDFGSSLVFVVACAALGAMIPGAVAEIKSFTRGCFEAVALGSKEDLTDFIYQMTYAANLLILKLMAPFLGCLFAVALFVGYIQVGTIVSLKAMMPKFSKLNPMAGLKNMLFSSKAWIELVKSFIKVFVAGYLAWAVLSGSIRDILMTLGRPAEEGVALTMELCGSFLKRICGFMLAVGALDLGIQRWQWKKGMMMSKQEVKDEYKQDEGDPHHKHQRKKLHKEILNAKSTKSAAQAKAVVKNPIEIAVAIDYDPETMNAPKIVTKGERNIAKEIIRIAEEAGVPIMENIALAHALNELEIDDEVPEDLYEAIAEVLNWVYALAEEEEARKAAEAERLASGELPPPGPGPGAIMA